MEKSVQEEDTLTNGIDGESSREEHMMDSKVNTEVMHCLEKGTYYQNVELCEDNSFVIDDKGVLDANAIQESLPEGRRIVDISFMWNEIHRTFNNHARGIECQFKDWKLVNSRRRGLLTQLFFKCQMCNYEANIWSEPTESEQLDINTAAVAATVTVGIGYAQLEELCAAINIVCMSDKTYIKHRENLVDDFMKTAVESMQMAGEAEKQLALERGETINGIPYITVVADGSWMKRSYGTAYDSPSGVGAIIGYRTRKVLFVGIRNKFCTVCDMAQRRGLEPRSHRCYKNFDSNASSTSMESDAIAEGFKSSLEMHGLIYKAVIADGDSSVFQCIKNNAPYREQKVIVNKIECSNHLLRNLCKKLKAVAETVQPKSQRKHGFVQVRNVVRNNILKIRRDVLQVAAVQRVESKPHHYKAMELQKDILNIPSHIFGEHKKCKERGRTCEHNSEKIKNYVPYLKLYGLYSKIESAIMHLSAYSDSLLLNLTNNPAESFNSIICKEIGGKRIHFGKRGSYNARIAGAVVQHNSQQVLTQVHESMYKNVPFVVANLEKRRQIKIARSRESRKIDGRRKKSKEEQGTDCHYGPQSQRPDLPSDVLKQLEYNHMEKLVENAENRQVIEQETRGQSQCELWLSLRREMLTASNFGMVCRMRPTTSCAATVKNILFPPGLFIDYENPFLGASPDGLIDNDGLVEIKCPLSAENFTADEAIKKLPHLKSVFDKKDINKMNRNHRFFYQVQGQLNITQRDYCIFTVWTPKSLKIVRVNADKAFWEDAMLPFLTRFYYECMLPEILDSRYNRHMPIRNPKYIIDAKKNVSKNKINNKQKITQQNKEQKEMQKGKDVERYVLSTDVTNVI
jgi:hypothetical protein